MVFAGGERIIIAAQRHHNYSFFIIQFSVFIRSCHVIHCHMIPRRLGAVVL